MSQPQYIPIRMFFSGSNQRKSPLCQLQHWEPLVRRWRCDAEVRKQPRRNPDLMLLSTQGIDFLPWWKVSSWIMLIMD